MTADVHSHISVCVQHNCLFVCIIYKCVSFTQSVCVRVSQTLITYCVSEYPLQDLSYTLSTCTPRALYAYECLSTYAYVSLSPAHTHCIPHTVRQHHAPHTLHAKFEGMRSPCPVKSSTHAHTHTHTHTHAHTHSLTHSHKHTHTHSLSLTHTHTPSE